jgi:molecular chaperone GrpE
VAQQKDTEAEAEVVVPEGEQLEEVAVEETVVLEGEPEGARDELDGLREELEKAKNQAAEYLEGWQRAQAEFSNYKKRQEAGRAQTAMLANATLLRRLLPVADDFERAMATLPANLGQLTWCEGVLLIQHKLGAILESEGVKPIETDGQAFDPRYHEAVTYEQVSGYEEGQIIGEVQRGYTLGERVLRPALVRVARASVTQAQKDAEEDSDTTENVEGKE